MVWIIIGAILVIVGVIGLIVAISSTTDDGKFGGGITAIGCFFGFVILTIVTSTHLVGQREVGVVKSFSGTITGSVGSGVAFTAPWASITKENIGLQREDFNLGSANSAVSQDQQPIYADLSLNYNVEPQDVVNLYKTVGPRWKAILLDSRVLQDFKEVTSQYTAQEITTKREQLRQDTRARLKTELDKYGIGVVDFFVKNLSYSDSYRAAISAKNEQVQQALQAQAKVAQAQAEAEQAVATAAGQKRSEILQAQGDATAIALKGRAIRANPEVLKLEAIDKLNPNAEVIICTGIGEGNCPSFLPQAQQPTRGSGQ